MKYKLATLKPLTLEQLKEEFYSIEDSDNILEFDGDDYATSLFDFSALTSALSFLPPHISEINFKGRLQYLVYHVLSENDHAELYTDVYRYVGSYLSYIIGYIPVTVSSIKISLEKNYDNEFPGNLHSKVSRDMYYVLNKIPPHVTHLDLSETFYEEEEWSNWKDVLNMYLALPRTIKSIKMHRGDWQRCPAEVFTQIFKYLNTFIQDLSWKESAHFLLGKHKMENHFMGRIQQLSLRKNPLIFSESSALEYLKKIPGNIHSLDLAGNQFDKLAVERASALMASLPRHIQSLDLGENNLITLDTEFFNRVMLQLPKTIHTLRLIDNIQSHHSLLNILTNYQNIPSHVHTLSFSNSIHLRISPTNFRRILEKLPLTIQALDFSATSLFDYDLDDIQSIFSALPLSVKTLILRRNLLATIDHIILRCSLFSIPYSVKEIDISENGLDKLKYSSLSQFTQALPDRIYNLQKEKITLTHDGRLLPYYPRKDDLYFKPISKIRLQKVNASLFLCMSQLMRQKNISSTVFFNICAFLTCTKDPRDSLSLKHQLSKASLLVTDSKRRSTVDILSNIFNRITNNTKTTLDLSYAGLNQLRQPTDFIEIFRRIPHKIVSLNLRKNHLNQSAVFKTFCKSLHQLPVSIQYLDISGNGFDPMDYNVLEQFKGLPVTLKYISFGLERPIDLQAHLNKSLVPAYLPRLLSPKNTVMQKVTLLLNDYSQGNSWFWRVFYGYWNRSHLPWVSKLLYEISKGHQQFIEDILHQLSLLEMQNESGALAKSMLLMQKDVPHWRDFSI